MFNILLLQKYDVCYVVLVTQPWIVSTICYCSRNLQKVLCVVSSFQLNRRKRERKKERKKKRKKERKKERNKQRKKERKKERIRERKKERQSSFPCCLFILRPTIIAVMTIKKYTATFIKPQMCPLRQRVPTYFGLFRSTSLIQHTVNCSGSRLAVQRSQRSTTEQE